MPIPSITKCEIVKSIGIDLIASLTKPKIPTKESNIPRIIQINPFRIIGSNSYQVLSHIHEPTFYKKKKSTNEPQIVRNLQKHIEKNYGRLTDRQDRFTSSTFTYEVT